MSESRESSARARSLAGIYGLLARVFAREVDPELLDVLQRLEATGSVRLLCIDPDTAEAESASERLEALATEYCRLFLGPGACCAPYGSIYLGEALLGGRTEQRVLRFATAAGLRVQTESPVVAADHVAVLFEILSQLYANADSAPQGHHAEDFLRECVLPWVPQFVAQVQMTSPDTLYARAAGLAELALGNGTSGESLPLN